MSNTLDVLYQARDNLRSGSWFDFNSWESCTCGHIYMAAMERTGCEMQVSRASEAPYKDVINDVALALGWDPEEQRGPEMYVSDCTLELGDRDSEGEVYLVDRQHTIFIIQLAIEQIERAEREAMEATLVIADAHDAELVG